MRRRNWTVLAAVAVAAGIVAVPSALAAYSSPKLEVRQAGGATTLKATLSPDDDPTASVTIVVPTGTQLTTSQAPGTVLGPVRALVKALALGGADLPLEGQLIVAAPGQIPAESQAACLGAVTPLASWVMVLSAAGQTLNVPAYLVPTSGAPAALGPAFVRVCLSPPDIPQDQGGAAFGAKLYSAELTSSGVFGNAQSGPWVSYWTPYTPGAGTANIAGTVASPALVASGTATIAAKTAGKGAVVSGRVTQGGQGRAGVTVVVRGGPRAGALKRLGSVKTRANGSFSFRAKTGTFFRASAAAASGTAPQVCTTLGPAIAPVPCVNPTSSAFAVQTRTIRKR